MRKHKSIRRKLVGLGLLAAGSSLFANNCINFAASLPICGGVLTFCSPADQINLLWPLLQTPDFNADPSCTIPLGCGDGDLFDVPPGFPGGDAPAQPSDGQGGIGGGGGAGGGGGGGGGGVGGGGI